MAMQAPRSTDALFLFACRVACLQQWSEEAFTALVEAMADSDPDIRLVASHFVSELTNPAFAPRAHGQMQMNAGESL